MKTLTENSTKDVEGNVFSVVSMCSTTNLTDSIFPIKKDLINLDCVRFLSRMFYFYL